MKGCDIMADKTENKKPLAEQEKPSGEMKTVMINGEKKEVDEETYSQLAKRKTRWIACILYPNENKYHKMVLDYLLELGLTMCYIDHDAVTDSKDHDCKAHTHVMIYFDTPRTASGFCSSFGECPALFETPQEYELDEKGKKRKKKRTLIRVLDESEVINYDAALVGKTKILSHAETVSIPESYYRYLVHKDFKSRISHKKEYSWDDIKYCGDGDTVQKLRKTAFSNKGDILIEVKAYFDKYRSCRAVLGAMMRDSRLDLVSYIETHSYFVRTFFEVGENKAVNSDLDKPHIILS